MLRLSVPATLLYRAFMHPSRPAWKSKRPAPRNAPGRPPQIADTVTWTREFSPPELYRVEYIDRDHEISVREIGLLRLGVSQGVDYLGVMHGGKFKTLRLDRIRAVEQLSIGHTQSIEPQPTYQTVLPVFPCPGAIYRIPTIAGKRTWQVDLNSYTCACPEKRIRAALHYAPGQLGFVCPHIARAILDYLPADAHWPPDLLRFLADPRNIHIDNLE